MKGDPPQRQQRTARGLRKFDEGIKRIGRIEWCLCGRNHHPATTTDFFGTLLGEGN